MQRTTGRPKGGHLRAVLYLVIATIALCLFISHGNVTLRSHRLLSRLQVDDDALSQPLLASSGAWYWTACACIHIYIIVQHTNQTNS